MLSTIEMFTGLKTQVDNSGFKNEGDLMAQSQCERVSGILSFSSAQLGQYSSNLIFIDLMCFLSLTNLI